MTSKKKILDGTIDKEREESLFMKRLTKIYRLPF